MDFSNLSNEAMRMANELQNKFGLVDAGNKIVPTVTGGQIELNEFKSASGVVKAMLLMRLTSGKIKCISILVVCRESTIVPHWTFEFVETGRPGASFMCFVDFLSRVDLGVELDYVKDVYMPLSSSKKELLELTGSVPTELQLIQRCCHSPWATALSFTNTHIEQVIPRFNKFYEHFLSLTSNTSLSNVSRLSDEMQLERDRKQRRYVYNVEVDPIWTMFKAFLGADPTDQLLNAYLSLGFN